MAKYVIKDSERGHRPLLSPLERTISKTVKLPESLFKFQADMGGSKFIRELIGREYEKLRKKR